MSQSPHLPLVDRLQPKLVVHDTARVTRGHEALQAAATGNSQLLALLNRPAVTAMLDGIFSASPYLTSLIVRYPSQLQRCLVEAPETLAGALAQELRRDVASVRAQSDVMTCLRIFKAHIALLTALADVGGVWPVMQVTHILADAADVAVAVGLSYLFCAAQARGDWVDGDAAPEGRSGYFIVAMGKHGAFELNYSSDIDLIVFYNAAKARMREGLEVQTFYVRLTRDLIKLLQQPTEYGYVFRTDLRLRPDPGSTPIAISTSGAMHYYESVGQNWERAALIKARVIAGDRAAGEAFLERLQPFIWRKYLDFAAIADVHAMKRQIHAVRGFGHIAVAGHNIKVGRGGIREIEFFAQTQQLIAGGRQRDLRIADTLGALGRLATRGWISEAVRDELSEAYQFLRTIEHRLQMVADEQTQTLPSEPDALQSLACFSGFSTFDAFADALRRRLETVQRHYSQLFELSPSLTAHGRDMVFAGAADDPATIAALSDLGFSSPRSVIEIVRGWHHGRVRAIRSPRARELLTEVQPRLIEALAATANPDQAIAGFDRFLVHLPSGVQLFSLLKQHPGLLDLVAAIMGTAPRLAQVLGRRGRVLDAVLDPGFFGALAQPEALTAIIQRELSQATTYEQVLDRARITGSEQAFLIGVRVLTGTISATDAGRAYAALADRLVEALASAVETEMGRSHGPVPGGSVAVVALGKLGGREMTAASDLDLMVIYDFDPAVTLSQGLKPLAPAQYYARYTQRLIGAFTAPTSEGALYDIDLRLRPSGQKGPVATQLSSFIDYQAKEAWTWEHMALTRARVIAGPPGLRHKIENAIETVLRRPRECTKIAADVREMRVRMADAKGTQDPWDLKMVRGGLVDLEFIAQYLQLVHAAQYPEVLDQSTVGALRKLGAAGCLPQDASNILLSAAHRFNALTQVLRLCLIDRFVPDAASDGLKRLLAQAGEAPTFDVLSSELIDMQVQVAGLFDTLIA